MIFTNKKINYFAKELIEIDQFLIQAHSSELWIRIRDENSGSKSGRIRIREHCFGDGPRIIIFIYNSVVEPKLFVSAPTKAPTFKV
jgi:hypothetical protein